MSSSEDNLSSSIKCCLAASDVQMSSPVIQQNKDGFIIDCVAQGNLILDIISQEPIKYKHHMIIHNQIYNFYTLYNYIRYKFNKDKEIATIPHNRAKFTVKILEEINSKFKNKSKIIIEIIKFRLLEFPQQMQECLLALKDDQREIILEAHKINLIILMSIFDSNIVITLILQYYHLFLDNTTDAIIKSALQENTNALLLLSTDKITEDIAKFVVQIDGMSLMLIPDYLRTEEIIKLAVTNNGIVIKYINKEKMTKEIIKLAVQNCIDKLKNQIKDKIFEEAIINDINTLKKLLNKKSTAGIITQTIINNINISYEIIRDELIKLSLMNDSDTL